MDLDFAYRDDAVNLAYYLAQLDLRTFPKDAMTEEQWKDALSGKWCCVLYSPDWTAASVIVWAAKIAYLYSNAVVLGMRGQGIGEQMIRERIEIARAVGCVKVEAHTRSDNEQAQRLLRKCGFLATDYVPDFYDDYEDGIRWELIL